MRVLARTMAAIAPAATAALAGAQAPMPAAHAWRPISTHAPELRPLLDTAREALPRRAPLAGVFRAEQQFTGRQVAYRLILVLADGGKWRVTLLPQGPGAWQAGVVEPLP